MDTAALDDWIRLTEDGPETLGQSLLERLLACAPAAFALNEPGVFQRAQQVADRLRRLLPSLEAQAALEADLAGRAPQASLLVQLAVKLARSRSLLELGRGPAFVSVVFAVYKEHVRALSPAQHPHGEDFLVRKVRQLDWLFAGLPDLDYDLIVVDDGCPEGSGRILQRIARENGLEDRVRVLFLADAIAGGHPAVGSLASTDESRKGGAITYGMWEACCRERPGHVVVYTDADLSTHLGQTGLLVDAIRRGHLAAVGSRRDRLSAVVKKGQRNERGKLFIYLWKRLLPALGRITDTQCGFKGFDAAIVHAICSGAIEKQFAFDIELMLRTELTRPGAIERVPLVWIDSEAESTTTDLQPYLTMLKSAVAIYRRYLPRSEEAEPFAQFIEELDESEWQRLLGDIPEEITRRDPADFDRFAEIGVDRLAAPE